MFISLTLFPNTIKKRRRENSVSGNRARARVVLPTITSRAAKNESKRFEDVLRKAHVQRSKKLRVVVVVVVVHSARILSSDVETEQKTMRNDAKQNGMVASREKCLLPMFLRILLYLFNSIAKTAVGLLLLLVV